MLPVNLDQYSRYVTLDDSELRELNVAEGVLVRLHRLRGMYAYWLQFPSKLDNDLVQYDIAMFKVSRSLAYEDLHLVKVLLGNLQQTTKEFMRWKINKSIEQDIAAARRAGEFREATHGAGQTKMTSRSLSSTRLFLRISNRPMIRRFSASSAFLTCVARSVRCIRSTLILLYKMLNMKRFVKR